MILIQIIGEQLRKLLFIFSILICDIGQAQQILWTKLYPIPLNDNIFSLAQDSEGNVYASGSTGKNPVPGVHAWAIVYKLNPAGDTLFSKHLGIPGSAGTMVVDKDNMLRITVYQNGPGAQNYRTILLRMTLDGFIFKRDTLSKYIGFQHSIIAKDGSWILVGQTQNQVTGNWQDMVFQRVRHDGSIDPYITFNPGHPDCAAHRIEQLPNGKYLMSGHIGSRVVTYTLDSTGGNPIFEVWFQTPDLSFLNSGYVSRINGQRYMIGGQGNPSIIGQYDSLHQKYWLKKDNGNQIPPQAMLDGSVAVGYRSGMPPYQTFFRIGADSQYVWNMAFRDSLLLRGFFGNLDLFCFTFLEDQSAVLAGMYDDGNGITDQDPFFIKIANVGTPVTSLLKPKKGPLANETLAPWPNPTGGTLYLKQHFDRAEIHLYNMSGKEVGSYKIGFAQPIDVSGYESGVYLYRAVIDGKVYSGKVVKR